jgi:hypothetical protein
MLCFLGWQHRQTRPLRLGSSARTSLDRQSGHHQSAEFLQQTCHTNAPQGDADAASTGSLVSSNGGVQLRRGISYRRPRIGTGTGQPTLLSPSVAYQFVFSKVVKQTQVYVTLRRVSNSQELAKIDPDTGLQEIVGPSVNKVLAVSLQRNFPQGGGLRLLFPGGRQRHPDGRACAGSSKDDLGWCCVGESTSVPSPSSWRVRIREGKAPW